MWNLSLIMLNNLSGQDDNLVSLLIQKKHVLTVCVCVCVECVCVWSGKGGGLVACVHARVCT